MPRWVGLLGSWALLVLAVGLAGVAVVAEWINLRDIRMIRNARIIDDAIRTRMESSLQSTRGEIVQAKRNAQQLEREVSQKEVEIRDRQDTDQIIVVSTEENKVYVRRNGKTVFETICSTGKGTTLVENGRTTVFNTPIGKFRIISKEENPVWVPPDWHFIEEAKKTGGRVIRLQPGMSLNARTGNVVSGSRSSGFWSWSDSPRGPIMKVRNNNVVIEENGRTRSLPKGEVIRAGNTIVIPPIGSPQREYEKVLGTHRLNLGDGYALHGTQQVSQLGRSVSHGCVRLKNEDIAHLYEIANVGDEVIIY